MFCVLFHLHLPNSFYLHHIKKAKSNVQENNGITMFSLCCFWSLTDVEKILGVLFCDFWRNTGVLAGFPFICTSSQWYVLQFDTYCLLCLISLNSFNIFFQITGLLQPGEKSVPLSPYLHCGVSINRIKTLRAQYGITVSNFTFW